MPNVLGTAMVNATFQAAHATQMVAALRFLGLRCLPPGANWGEMLPSRGSQVFAGDGRPIWSAGLCFVSVVVGFNFVGNGLRGAVEVRW